MKKIIFHSLIIAALMVVAGCNFNRNNSDKKQIEKAAATNNLPDSLKHPIGNMKLDSLLQLTINAKQDTNLAKLYNDIGYIYMDNNPQKAIEYFLKMKELNEQMNWNKGRHLFAKLYSIMLARQGLVDSAITVSRQGLELAKKENNADWIADQTATLAIIYKNKGWFETALPYFTEVLPYYEQKNDTKTLGYIYYLMSFIYTSLGKNEKAIEYGEKSLTFRKDEYTLESLAEVYSNMFQFEKAKSYYLEALRFCDQHDNNYIKGMIYFHLSDDAFSYSDLETVEKYINLAAEINKKTNLLNIEILLIRSRIEAFKGHFALSEKQVREALKLAKERNNPLYQKFCYTTLSELTIAQRRDFREWVQYWTEIITIDRNTVWKETIRSVEEMQAKYETEKKELEIARQQQIIKKQNLQRGLLAGGVVVSIVILALLWYILRLRTRRNRALAEMNVTKDKFFSIVSHDLKNPALAQRDALQLLIKNARLWDTDTLTNYYHDLLKSADGQVELLYNLLNWAQIQTGRMAYTPAAFNLPARLRSDIALIRKMAENKGITFVVEMPEDALVTGDGNMLATVVRNLLTNAVKFTPAGGTVTLAVSPSDKGACPLAYTISINDTGTGMNEEQIRNLFQLGSGQSRRGTADEQGSGLGLIVCKELLGKHGSELHVESEEGRGSRFWFEVSA